MVDAKVAARHGAVPHWAKVEVPEHPGQPQLCYHACFSGTVLLSQA